MAGISRRSALAALGGVAVLPFATWWEAVAQQPGQPVVRHSAHSAEGKAALRIYREAVRIMASRQPGDWDGWTVWYKSHQFPDDWDDLIRLPPPAVAEAQRQELDRIFGAGTPRRATAARLLGACPHGSPDFWAWHRMYLLFFERLCRKLTGESGFALPYWDYRSNPVLPEEFRAPVGKTANPLWHERWSGYNKDVNPEPLPVSQLRYDFLRNRDFFGAQRQSEGSPHGTVHVLLGAGPDWETATELDMTFVGRSARDPIFWLHHCEIDRLWQGWVSHGHANPTMAGWLENQSTRPGGYAFMDELTGQLVAVRNRDILDSALVLGRSGYTYDQLPPVPAGLFSGGSADQRDVASTARVTAGDERTDQPLETSASELQRLRGGASLMSAGDLRVEVSVRAVEVQRAGASNIGVYLNLPEGVSGEAAEAYLVTVISTFGRMPAGAHEGHGEEAGGTLVFDATAVVGRLAERNELGDRLVVSTVPLAGSRGVSVNIEGVRVRVLEGD